MWGIVLRGLSFTGAIGKAREWFSGMWGWFRRKRKGGEQQKVDEENQETAKKGAKEKDRGYELTNLEEGEKKKKKEWHGYKPPPPSTREVKDPLSALGMILMGGPLALLHLGPLEEVLKHTRAFIDHMVMNFPVGWDGYRNGSAKKGQGGILSMLERQSAERNGIVTTLKVGEAEQKDQAQKRGMGHAS